MNSTETIAELNKRFGVPGLASVVAGGGRLPKVVISSPIAAGEMYLHGGHVTSWVPAGASDVLYCSPNTTWQDGHAIRGGVPICFPWFGDKADNRAAPAHGVVRTKSWELASVEQTTDGVAITMATSSDTETRKWWPGEFRLECRATFGAELKIELTVGNTGGDAFMVEEAMHAYFHVGDVERVLVRGLAGANYIDKVDHYAEKTQTGEVQLTGETDRVYLATTGDLEIVDGVMSRHIGVHKHNSNNTVVWNPWSEKSATMRDLGAGEWEKFVCVETANIGKAAVLVAPGATHTMAVRVWIQ